MWGLVTGMMVLGYGIFWGIPAVGEEAPGLGFRIWGSGFRVQGLGFRV